MKARVGDWIKINDKSPHGNYRIGEFRWVVDQVTDRTLAQLGNDPSDRILLQDEWYDVVKPRYEVRSRLNPRYAETGSMDDYYGIYEVVKYIEGKEVGIVTTQRADLHGDARSQCYLLAKILNGESE